jgi:hypothetical protein
MQIFALWSIGRVTLLYHYLFILNEPLVVSSKNDPLSQFSAYLMDGVLILRSPVDGQVRCDRSNRAPQIRTAQKYIVSFLVRARPNKPQSIDFFLSWLIFVPFTYASIDSVHIQRLFTYTWKDVFTSICLLDSFPSWDRNHSQRPNKELLGKILINEFYAGCLYIDYSMIYPVNLLICEMVQIMRNTMIEDFISKNKAPFW